MNVKGLGVLLVALLVVQVFLISSLIVLAQDNDSLPSVFVGVDVAYENMTATKQLIDDLTGYANLFIIGCSGVSYNYPELYDLCQYLYDRGFYFIIYRYSSPRPNLLENLTKWGNHFLGFYAWDELGGKQLDRAGDEMIVKNTTEDAVNALSDASSLFVSSLNKGLWSGNNSFTQFYNTSLYPTYPLFTSDYALYWFDYKAGYNVVFAELGWNYSRQLNIALCRGAANAQNKEWGAMILWTYTHPPYLTSGSEIYDDMRLAYDSGAKYICVFDTNIDYNQETLGKEHLDAIKQFWQYIQENPRPESRAIDRVAYVLPQDYAYGFRGPDDKIWGLWEADEVNPPSYDISMGVSYLINMIGPSLDIVYEDNLSPASEYGYQGLIYWNDPAIFDPPIPNISPFPTRSPEHTISPTSTVSPISFQTPTHSPALSPSPNLTMKPDLTPTLTFKPRQTTSNFPIEYFYTGTVSIASALILLSIVIIKKRKNTK